MTKKKEVTVNSVGKLSHSRPRAGMTSPEQVKSPHQAQREESIGLLRFFLPVTKETAFFDVIMIKKY